MGSSISTADDTALAEPRTGPRAIGTDWLFAWATPLLQRGAATAQLHQHDLFELPSSLQPAACQSRLWGCWRAELSGRAAAAGRSPSLLRALASAYGSTYAVIGLLKLASDALNFAGPVLLNALLRHLSGIPSSPNSRSSGKSDALGGGGGLLPDPSRPAFGYAAAGGLAAALVLKALLGGQYGYRQGLLAAQLRAAITSSVYRKALLLNAASLAAVGTGEGWRRGVLLRTCRHYSPACNAASMLAAGFSCAHAALLWPSQAVFRL